ncbi:MAG: TolC family protein [Candidatus Poribacteria bacterium]|nr:TolC family protein [Candidatus Poribacteria bacterium]
MTGVAMACAVASAQEGEVPTYTLDDAIQYAWAHHTQMGIAAEAIEAAKAGVGVARAGFMPKVSLNGSYTYNGKLAKQVLDFGDAGGFPTGAGEGVDLPTVEDPATQNEPIEFEFGTKRDYRGIAQLEQPLFTWGKIRNGYNQAQTVVDAEELAFETTKRDMALQVTQAFYGVILGDEVAEVSRAGFEQAQKRLETAKLRFEAGAATKLDVLQAEVGVAHATAQMIRAENTIRLSRLGFALALGVTPDETNDVTLVGDLAFENVEADPVTLVYRALEARSDLLALRARREGAEYLTKIAKAGNKPNAAATGTYSWNDTEKQDAQTTWSVGVGVNFPLFDGFATRNATKRAQANARQLDARIQDLRGTITYSVGQAYVEFNAARAVVAAQENAVAQAEEALRISNLSFENGLITSVELSEAELTRTQTQLSYLQATFDAVIARARLEYAVGAEL